MKRTMNYKAELKIYYNISMQAKEEEDTKNETTALKQSGEGSEGMKYTDLETTAIQPDTKLKYLILSLICLITLAM